MHDPFLERFRIGSWRNPTEIEISDGWPEGLLAPLDVDTAWTAAAGRLLDRDALPQDEALCTWRLAGPALGSAAAVTEWFAAQRESYRLLVAVAQGERLEPAPDPDVPFAREILMLQASRLWEKGHREAAAQRAELLVDRAAALELAAETRFVWAMRRDRLRGVSAGGESDLLWTGLVDLGLYDARSGWALWLACRRELGRAPIPATAADRDLGLLLGRSGETWLTARELYAAGFAPGIEAGLGALTLSRDELVAHFERHPTPPADGRFQGYWLQGQRRRRPGEGAWYEELARLPGLKDGRRLDMWRRASEARLLAKDWESGLEDLAEGVALMDSEASRYLKRLFRHWLDQALVLALAHGRTEDARRVWSLAVAELPPEQAESFREEAALWRPRVDPGAPMPASAENTTQRAARRVAAGDALPAESPAVPLPDAATWRDELWRLWALWGLGLAEREDPGELAATPALAEHRDGLVAVRDAAGPQLRHAAACALGARYLRGGTDVAILLGWALSQDIQRVSAGRALPGVSPIPSLSEATASRDLRSRWRQHAFLSIALAADDLRGMLAVAVSLSSPGLTADERLRFLYPVPAAPWLRAALSAGRVAPEWLLAVARNESLFEPGIRSRAGALGYVQIMPFHFDQRAQEPGPGHWSHADVSLSVGTELLTGELTRFGGDPYRAVAAYNAGAGAVKRWDRQLGGNAGGDLFLAWIGYDETRRYVAAVLTDREIYRQILAVP